MPKSKTIKIPKGKGGSGKGGIGKGVIGKGKGKGGGGLWSIIEQAQEEEEQPEYPLPPSDSQPPITRRDRKLEQRHPRNSRRQWRLE